MAQTRQLEESFQLAGKPPRRRISPRIGLVTYALLLLTFWLLDQSTISLPPQAQFLLQEGVLIIGVPVLVSLIRRVPLERALRLRLPPRPLLALWLIGCSLVFIVFYYYFTMLLARFSPVTKAMVEDEARWILYLAGHTSPLMLVTGGVIVAFAEELFFRGFFLRSIEKQWNALVVCLLCGFCFSAVHLNLGKLLPVFLAGSWFSYVALRSASLWPSVIAHFALNLTGLLLVVSLPHLNRQLLESALRPSAWGLLVFLPLLGLLLVVSERAWRRGFSLPQNRPGDESTSSSSNQ